MSSISPSPIGPATAAKRGTQSAAHFSKLEALPANATLEARLNAIESVDTSQGAAITALQGQAHAASTLDPANSSWLTLVGQVLKLTLVAAANGVAGIVTEVAQSFSGAKRGVVVTLTSSAGSLGIDLAAANNFSHTLAENTTLAAPSNPVAGQSGVIVLTQHASSPKTLGFNSFWKFAGGTVPTLTATNGAVDVLAYYVESSGRATCSLVKDVK